MLKSFATISLLGVLGVQGSELRTYNFTQGHPVFAQLGSDQEEAATQQEDTVIEETEGEEFDDEGLESQLVVDPKGEEFQAESARPITKTYGAYKGGGGEYMKDSFSDWDARGRDQDYSEDISYSKTNAKAYAAESYDEWDNKDNDKWGAQSWGKDRDVYGASSYGKAASGSAYSAAGRQGGYGAAKGYGGYGVNKQQGASAEYGAAKGGYDNDVWAKQAGGSDYDSRWGKSYDSVSAKSYDNEEYTRRVWADDDQWAEDYDTWNSKDIAGGGGAASYGKTGGYSGYGQQAPAYKQSAASKGYGGEYMKDSGSKWDAWGRDQDLAIDESYSKTNAKSYGAESYDEWDNQDDDKWGGQSWGQDRDQYGASSYGNAASAKQGGYGAYGASKGYGGYGGYRGDKRQGASAQQGAAAGAYNNDMWAKQAGGSDFDSRWGKSYDSVSAKSYDNEEYARKVRADDDQWAEDYDRFSSQDIAGGGGAASYGKTGGYSGYGQQAPAYKQPAASYGKTGGYSGYGQQAPAYKQSAASYGKTGGYSGYGYQAPAKKPAYSGYSGNGGYSAHNAHNAKVNNHGW